MNHADRIIFAHQNLNDKTIFFLSFQTLRHKRLRSLSALFIQFKKRSVSVYKFTMPDVSVILNVTVLISLFSCVKSFSEFLRE